MMKIKLILCPLWLRVRTIRLGCLEMQSGTFEALSNTANPLGSSAYFLQDLTLAK
jgi:hypothetical protein